METVPRGEIDFRIRNFQEALEKAGLDGAFILQNTDLFYFSGTIQTSVLFVPVRGEPLLMVRKGLERVRQESSLKHIFPVGSQRQVKKIVGDFGFLGLKRIGLELDVLPANLYIKYRQTFPEYEWSDVSRAILRLRMIKTPYEVGEIRRAAGILDRGYLHLKEVIREGMTELEVDGHLALFARQEGHMGILRMRGWNQEMTYAHVLSGESGAVVSFLNSPHGGTGNTPAMAQGASSRRIRRDEPIGIDYGVGIHGYLADEFRTFVIGDLEAGLLRAHDLSVEIHRLFVREAKPGIPCSHLYRLALKEAEKAGLQEYFMGYGEEQAKFIGHGIGLEIDEFPVLAPRSPQKLEAGMVIALEPKFAFPGKGIVGVEDDYLVTASGVERLTLTAQAIIRL